MTDSIECTDTIMKYRPKMNWNKNNWNKNKRMIVFFSVLVAILSFDLTPQITTTTSVWKVFKAKLRKKIINSQTLHS